MGRLDVVGTPDRVGRSMLEAGEWLMVVRWTVIVPRIVVVAVDMLSRLRILTFVVLRYPETF